MNMSYGIRIRGAECGVEERIYAVSSDSDLASAVYTAYT